jgi:hypothetical protein
MWQLDFYGVDSGRSPRSRLVARDETLSGCATSGYPVIQANRLSVVTYLSSAIDQPSIYIGTLVRPAAPVPPLSAGRESVCKPVVFLQKLPQSVVR